MWCLYTVDDAVSTTVVATLDTVTAPGETMRKVTVTGDRDEERRDVDLVADGRAVAIEPHVGTIGSTDRSGIIVSRACMADPRAFVVSGRSHAGTREHQGKQADERRLRSFPGLRFHGRQHRSFLHAFYFDPMLNRRIRGPFRPRWGGGRFVAPTSFLEGRKVAPVGDRSVCQSTSPRGRSVGT
jgi:hypothetical protein